MNNLTSRVRASTPIRVMGLAGAGFALALPLPGVAAAESGSPGSVSAAGSTYGPTVLGEQTPGSNGENPPGQPEPVVLPERTGTTSVPFTAAEKTVSASDTSLPFTGLAAGLVIGTGLLLIAGGALVRRLAGRGTASV